ncbi:MAG: sigma-70 family RNA polymerase sigma factor [Planctomycetota bacterium]
MPPGDVLAHRCESRGEALGSAVAGVHGETPILGWRMLASPGMGSQADPTAVLLARWARGDDAARNELLVRDLQWVRAYVHRRLGDQVRRWCETGDLVQEVMLRMMAYAPRFPVATKHQWRGLVGRITLNAIRGAARGLRALEDVPERLTTLVESIVGDHAGKAFARPDANAEAGEELANLRLGLLVLGVEDQLILELHFQGSTDAEIGERLGRNGNAVRTRRARALNKLFELSEEIRAGTIGRRFEGEGAAPEG